ncbi:MAG: NADH-quinone oxidoreductase subunit M [Acidocella sp.]|nr:NADH-quinone oxidoreductase subunit M [Acidocella sp.]MDE8350049.1 NADH-quinone oxidoreductase subunit M [Acidocella sp.]
MLLIVPIAGGLLAWLAGRFSPLAVRIVSLLVLLLDLAIALPLLHGTSNIAMPGNWMAGFNAPWIPAFGMNFRLGMDGVSWLLAVLTILIGIFAIIVSWDEIDDGVGFFHANLLWSLAGAIGVFVALDMFLFFYFWELMLVPMYFIIAIWGHENRRRAAIKFFLFTQGSGLLILLSILALAFLHQQQTGVLTFNYFELIQTHTFGTFGFLVMLGLFIAFIVKLASFPVHAWLPETHTEAPTAGSVILASILLKTGAYGLLRFVIPLVPMAAHSLAPVALWLGVGSILYGAFLAYGQSDLKKLIAYTSISHMGFVLIGVFVFNNIAWQGVVLLLVAHGISTGALFIIVGSVQHRLHTRNLAQMGGMWTDLPRLSSFGTFFILASMGLPGLGNFVGEFLILRGAWSVAPLITVIAAIGLIPAALYSLIAIQRAFHGPVDEERDTHDFGTRETAMMLVLAAAIIYLGVYPQPVLNIAAPSLNNMQPQPATAMLKETRAG